MKKILFCIAATMFATMTIAQEQQGGEHRRREFNPEEMAQRQTESINQALQLDSIQYMAIFLMNYADALTMQDSIHARRERAEKMRKEGKKAERPTNEEMNAMRELHEQRELVRDEQMQKILNPEQYKKYLKYKEEQKERMRDRRSRRGGRRDGRIHR